MFTPLQARVASHYADGEFAHIDSIEEAKDCGDTLLMFCLHEAHEAHDAADADELRSMLDTAIRQLQALQDSL